MECRTRSPHRSIVIFSSISSVICLAILSLSFVDLGRASLGTNIALPIITLIYHAVILLKHRRLQASANDGGSFLHPTATTASLVCIYSLIPLWFVPFGIINGLDTKYRHNMYFHHFFHGSPGTVGAQMGLDSSEAGFLTSLAITSTITRVLADRRAKAEAAGRLVKPEC